MGCTRSRSVRSRVRSVRRGARSARCHPRSDGGRLPSVCRVTGQRRRDDAGEGPGDVRSAIVAFPVAAQPSIVTWGIEARSRSSSFRSMGFANKTMFRRRGWAAKAEGNDVS